MAGGGAESVSGGPRHAGPAAGLPGAPHAGVAIDEPTYPAIGLLLRHGAALALLVGLGIALPGVAAALAGGPWWLGVAGPLAGALAWLLLRSYCEVLRIVTDTLAPQ